MIRRWLHMSRLGMASFGAALILLAGTTGLGAAEPTSAHMNAQSRCEAKAAERGLSQKASQKFVSRCTERAVARKADRVAERKAKRAADRASRSAGPLPEQSAPAAKGNELE
jgi:urocanate hydratase